MAITSNLPSGTPAHEQTVSVFRNRKPEFLRILAAGLFLTLICCASQAQTMQRILSRNTPAHQAARLFMRGINLGNSLEYRTGDPAGGLSYSATDFAQIKAEGFDHVRIPVAWHLYCGPAPSFTISNSIYTRVDAVVNAALSRGLAVILNEHHFHALSENPNANSNQFHAIWQQVAARYSNSPANLAFELLNEPNGAATSQVVSRIYPETIRRIRLTNPARTLFLGPGEFNGLGELRVGGPFVLPNNDSNIIVTAHCYDPYYFTHQGAEWALPDTATTGVLFPGPPPVPLNAHTSISHSWVIDWFNEYSTKPALQNPSGPNAFIARLRNARSWSEFYGRPVHIGEFGCYEKADPVSRVRYHKEIRESMDQLGLGWAMWDWKAGFHYSKNGRPDPAGIREAIFPPIELAASIDNGISFPAAIGKTYRVQRASSLQEPVTWETIATETLTTPGFFYSDASLTNSGGFFRVEWIK